MNRPARMIALCLAAYGPAFSADPPDGDAAKAWPISEFPEIQAAYARGDYQAAIERAFTTADQQDIPEMSARGGVVHQHSLFSPIINTWVEKDPEAAAAWALELPGAQKKPALVNMKVYTQILVAAGLVDRGDPRRAAEFLLPARKNASRDGLLEKAARLWAEKELIQAAAWAEGIKQAEDRSLAVQGILGPWAKTDPAGAAAFAGQIEEDFRRHWELCGIAIEWAKTDPKKAATLTRSIEVADARSRAAKAVAARLTWIDPDAAFKLLEVIEKEGERMAARVNALWHWAEKEPEKALASTESIEHRPSKLWAVTAVWGGWAKKDPEKAVARVKEAEGVTCCDKPQCKYPGRKTDVYYAIAGNWAEKDPDQAAQWFRTLPEAQRKAVLKKAEPFTWVPWVPRYNHSKEFKQQVKRLAGPTNEEEPNR